MQSLKEKVVKNTENSSTHVGGVMKLGSCCREIRIGSSRSEKGDILSGWNTLTDQYEEYEVIQVSKKDHWKSLVRRVK
jgi:hypothetical protein